MKRQIQSISRKAGEKTKKVKELDDRVKELGQFAEAQHIFGENIHQKIQDVEGEQDRNKEMYEKKITELEDKLSSELAKKSEQISKLEKQRDEILQKMSVGPSEDQFDKYDAKLQSIISRLDKLDESRVETLAELQNVGAKVYAFEQAKMEKQRRKLSTPGRVEFEPDVSQITTAMAEASLGSSPSSPQEYMTPKTPKTPGFRSEPESPTTPEISPGLFNQIPVIDTPFVIKVLDLEKSTPPPPISLPPSQQVVNRQAEILEQMQQMQQGFSGNAGQSEEEQQLEEEEQPEEEEQVPYIGVITLEEYKKFKDLVGDIKNINEKYDDINTEVGSRKYPKIYNELKEKTKERNIISEKINSIPEEDRKKLEEDFNKKYGEGYMKETEQKKKDLRIYKEEYPELVIYTYLKLKENEKPKAKERSFTELINEIKTMSDKDKQEILDRYTNMETYRKAEEEALALFRGEEKISLRTQILNTFKDAKEKEQGVKEISAQKASQSDLPIYFIDPQFIKIKDESSENLDSMKQLEFDLMHTYKNSIDTLKKNKGKIEDKDFKTLNAIYLNKRKIRNDISRVFSNKSNDLENMMKTFIKAEKDVKDHLGVSFAEILGKPQVEQVKEKVGKSVVTKNIYQEVPIIDSNLPPTGILRTIWNYFQQLDAMKDNYRKPEKAQVKAPTVEHVLQNLYTP
jgi:hypothetical protein